MDLRDWAIMGLVAAIQIGGTSYLFGHPTDMNFATWAALCSTLTAAYHWMVIKDSKAPDAVT